MIEIAVYGKGGIGKSTVSANLSAALADTGNRVLQLGCDPKHDSTRLLLQGKPITTALDYIRDTAPSDYRIEDVLFPGYKGIGCVEAGGPKPGVGCAGRGIISTFEFLERFNVKQEYDITVYDVLGDVVCGGFAVPIRQEYADTIFVVTSGEYMALYAANNILRGIRNYDHDQKRVAGIIFNRRNIAEEDQRIQRFAEAVNLPVVADIPRDDTFSHAEQQGMTLVEGNDPLAGVFHKLAADILAGIGLHEAAPVEDEELERVILGTVAVKKAAAESLTDTVTPGQALDKPDERLDLTDKNRYMSLHVGAGEPLHGCAFNGAVTMCVHLQDSVILAHAPKNCGFISYQGISSTGRRALYERGTLLPAALSPNFESTEMGDSEMVFGGTDQLLEKVEGLKKKRPKSIIVVSSCPSGIIGDDIGQAEALSEDNLPVIAIRADGNLAGDYLQGMIMSYTTLAKRIIRQNVPQIPNTVNVVFEKVVAKNTKANFEVMEELLTALGITVNTRFICETSYASLSNFLAAPLNILAYNDFTGRLLQDFFEKEYGCTFFKQAFPVGFDDTAAFLRGIADYFKRSDRVEDLIARHEEQYRREVQRLHPVLSGRRLMILTYNHDLDWILKAALDTGIEVVKIGVMDYSQDAGFKTRLDIPLPVEERYLPEQREQDIAYYKPDILLTNYSFNAGAVDYISDTIPMCPDVGFHSGIDMVRRWASLIALNVKGEWKDDERLFKKHYS